MDFVEYIKKPGVSENSKVNWNEMYCYSSNSRDEMYNILKSLLAIDIYPNMKWKWMIKVFTGACSSMFMCLLHSCFTKGAGRISLSQVFVNFFS